MQKKYNTLSFASIIKHQLKSPITPLLGYADMLAKGYLGELNSQQIEAVTIIIEQAEQLNYMLDTFLLYMSFEKEEVDIYPAEVKVIDLIKAEVKRLSEKMKAKEISVQYSFSEVNDSILGDPFLLSDLFYHLLLNAVAYGLPQSKIEISAKRNDCLTIVIQDNGYGIPEDKLDKVFDSFYQLSYDTKNDGLGLGLTLARKIARLHQGDVTLESTPDSGTIITVLLKGIRE